MKRAVDDIVLDVPHVIKEEGRRRLFGLVKQNQSQTVAHRTAQSKAGSSRNVPEHTVQLILLDRALRNRRPTHVPLLSKRHHQLRPGTSRLDQWKRVAWPDESPFVIQHAHSRARIRRLPREWLLPRLYVRSYKGLWLRYYASGDVFWGFYGTRGCDRADLELYRVSKHHCKPLAHDICLLKWKVPTGQRSVSQGANNVGAVPGT